MVTKKATDTLKLISIYHFITGAISLFIALAIALFALIPFSVFVHHPVGFYFGFAAISFAFVLTAGFGAASFIVGWGLLQLEDWARWGSIILAALSLLAFPIGTVIGVLIIIYLVNEDNIKQFK